MENNLYKFRKFTAIYWGQNVGCTSYVKNLKISKSNILNIEFLNLKSISDISDEQLLILTRIIDSSFPDSEIHHLLESKQVFIDVFLGNDSPIDNSHCLTKILNCYDYLRSESFLVPFNGLSTEELINRGWAVTTNLKTE